MVWDWIGLWRLGAAVLCLFAVALLLHRFYIQNQTWNEKTRDYWYAALVWNIAGTEYLVEGFIRHFPFTFRIIFFTLAPLVQLKGLIKKGTWGGE